MGSPKYIPGLAARVLRQIEEHPETWDQGRLPGECGLGDPACVGGHCFALQGFTFDAMEDPWPWWDDRASAWLGVGSDWAWAHLFGEYVDPRPTLRQLAARDEYMRTRSGGMGHGFCSALMEVHRD